MYAEDGDGNIYNDNSSTEADGEHKPSYGSVSAGREKSLFRVTFFVYGEPSCGQTIQNKIDFSIDFG